ncbi:GIY-YIG nuclease family protein [Salisediminibacterium halotolerans]|uniref:GIY-YIG nuclease family protein n=1 Tax=Salisediminibacterium halotolerans TaxID=517425 RepID=UPI000EAC19FC|nr:GIY-YIG nuclease family protein [Salisediminibacterium halotolerans]RLJ74488.1 Uri superfamily endonuclease [Actinophytocola xinjiangensis]RPE87419.1 Uri superfamily endonuclease [Salisediminibacterium halotolerans]TWG35324.1 Uri superfamily endonuclease [Salisediminibacterium halotolerans]GEL07956.1 hypothetical protein SHA02_13720 [Salisediminibacterium halotolerans]
MEQANSTLYVVWLYVSQEKQITIGKKGTFSFPKGHYLYIGSAKRGLSQRLQRHYRLNKKKRWHIDYFRENASWRHSWAFQEASGECALQKYTADLLKGEYPVPSLGSSDCCCPAHLIKVPEMSKTKGDLLSRFWHENTFT